MEAGLKVHYKPSTVVEKRELDAFQERYPEIKIVNLREDWWP